MQLLTESTASFWYVQGKEQRDTQPTVSPVRWVIFFWHRISKEDVVQRRTTDDKMHKKPWPTMKGRMKWSYLIIEREQRETMVIVFTYIINWEENRSTGCPGRVWSHCCWRHSNLTGHDPGQPARGGPAGAGQGALQSSLLPQWLWNKLYPESSCS